jgi:hypothetical protein
MGVKIVVSVKTVFFHLLQNCYCFFQPEHGVKRPVMTGKSSLFWSKIWLKKLQENGAF